MSTKKRQSVGYVYAVEVRDATKHIGWVMGGPAPTRAKALEWRRIVSERGHNVGPICRVTIPPERVDRAAAGKGKA